jgi:hypothetical protein
MQYLQYRGALYRRAGYNAGDIFYHGTSEASGLVNVGEFLDPRKSTYGRNLWLYATASFEVASEYAYNKAEGSKPVVLVIQLRPDARVLPMDKIETDDELRRAKLRWDAIYEARVCTDLGCHPEVMILRRNVAQVVDVIELPSRNA